MTEHAARVRRPAQPAAPRPVPPKAITLAEPGPDLAIRASRDCAAGPDAALSPSVHAALRTTGKPLDPDVRRVMEPAFDVDLSAVRVHTGDPAARSARAVGARAYTVGQDVVFGAGQYAPATAAGRALLAHELGHVRDGHSGSAALFRAPVDAPVAPPSAEDQRAVVDTSISFFSGAADFYAARLPVPRRRPTEEPEGPRVKIDRLGVQLAGWLRTRDTAANLIDTVLGADPALTQRLRTAYRAAVTALLEAAAREGRRLNRDAATGESAYQLFQKHQAVIHEWAWPTAVPDPFGTVLLDKVPEAERDRIRAGQQIPVTTAELDADFHPRRAATPTPGTTVSVAPGGPARVRTGLARLAERLVTAFGMPVDTTTTAVLDLGRYGGDRAVYRFTYVQHAAPGGRELLVERVSSAAADQRPAQQQATPDDLFKRMGFRPGAGTGAIAWSDEQFALLQSAIAQIPESMLGPVRGITFVRVSGANPTDPAAGASYSIDRHEIRVYDTAFQASLTPTYATPGRRASTPFDRLIAHEIAHALDNAPLRQQLATWRSSIAKQTQFKSSPPSKPGQAPQPPTDPAELKGWKKLQTQIHTNEAALTGARTLSGERWARNDAGQMAPTRTLPPGEVNDFLQAAAADGVVGITAYAETSVAENFAESFSFYVADPQSLSRLRPHIYAYFVRRFPDPQRPPLSP